VLVAALGDGVLDTQSLPPCATARWRVAGGDVIHEVRWITERGLDDGWLDDRVRITRG
jgi:hypothetical protein